MAVKVTVGVSRKVGQADYGSAGASCTIELEVDGHLFEADLDGFQERLKAAYVAAQQSVQDQLQRHQGPPPRSSAADEPVAAPMNGHAQAGASKGSRTWGGPARSESPASR